MRNGVLSWMGNKARMRRVIDEIRGECTTYVEGFAGGLGYFWIRLT